MANIHAACGDSDPEYKRLYEQIFNLESFHSLAHYPALQQAMQMLVGQKLLVHPKPMARLVFPNCERLIIQAHQDHLAIGGTPETFTAWMPLHDCPTEQGPLQILERSHVYGLQESNPATGMISKDAARGDQWVGGQINAGDVLIFHSLTVHTASPNISNHLRISLDCRFQSYEHVINPAQFVFPGSSGRSWDNTYARWLSDDLKYFWEEIPLQLKPSREELAKLAQIAEAPKMRSRYTRILEQLDRLMPANTN
jgi:ectoine hydroxylase-related dioxygenase (phytanoyl-CoA dioxygenase family)